MRSISGVFCAFNSLSELRCLHPMIRAAFLVANTSFLWWQPRPRVLQDINSLPGDLLVGGVLGLPPEYRGKRPPEERKL